MITFCADIRSAKAVSDDAITTSSVGIPIRLQLAPEFTGLAKTLVFRAGTTEADRVLIGDASESTVPVDVLTEAGQILYVGVYAADAQDGTIIIPTVWAPVGPVKLGTVPSGVDPSDPEPSWVAQVQSAVSKAVEDSAEALDRASEAVEDSSDALERAKDAQDRMTALEEEISDDLDTAENYAELSRSWAEGGTGKRQDEATNNAKYFSELAAQHAEQAGFVLFDIDDSTGELIVEVSDSLADDVRFELNENTGELEVIVA